MVFGLLVDPYLRVVACIYRHYSRLEIEDLVLFGISFECGDGDLMTDAASLFELQSERPSNSPWLSDLQLMLWAAKARNNPVSVVFYDVVILGQDLRASSCGKVHRSPRGISRDEKRYEARWSSRLSLPKIPTVA